MPTASPEFSAHAQNLLDFAQHHFGSACTPFELRSTGDGFPISSAQRENAVARARELGYDILDDGDDALWIIAGDRVSSLFIFSVSQNEDATPYAILLNAS